MNGAVCAKCPRHGAVARGGGGARHALRRPGVAPAARGGRSGPRSLPPPAQPPAARAASLSEKAYGPGGHGNKAPPAPKKAPPGQSPPALAPPVPAARRAQRKRYARHDLAGTDSSYLCLFCYEPLYVDINTAEEACFNRGCACYTGRGEISGNLAEHDGPRRVEEVCAESMREFRKFDRQFLLQKIHEARAVECAKFFRGGMNIGILASLDHLMTQLHDNASWGGSRDYGACRAAFGDYYEKFDVVQFTEDVCSRYYVTNAHSQRFVLKYHHAIREFLGTLGIVGIGVGARQILADQLPFYHIDKKPMGNPAKSLFDFETIFKNSLPLANALNHAFKMRYSTSKMYAYPDRPADFAALLSLWTTCPPGSAGAVTADRLREIYDGTIKKNKMDGDFDQFLEDCTSGRAYAPILVFDGEKYRFDYAALLLHLVYMFSNNRSRSGTQTEAGKAVYGRMRQVAASQFEAEIRQKLRGDGFDVRPRPNGGPFRPSFDSERKEFDCVAVDRDRKIIVLVEAKYEDMAPSSTAAGTMVGQLVLDRKTGLLAHAKKAPLAEEILQAALWRHGAARPRPAGRLFRLHRLHAPSDQARAADLAPHGSRHTLVQEVHVDRPWVALRAARLGRRGGRAP